MGVLIKSITDKKYDKVIQTLNHKFDLVKGVDLTLILEENLFMKDDIGIVGSGREPISDKVEEGYKKNIFSEVYAKPNEMPLRYVLRFGTSISKNFSWYADIKKSEMNKDNSTYVVIIPSEYDEDLLIEKLSKFLLLCGVEENKQKSQPAQTQKKTATKINST